MSKTSKQYFNFKNDILIPLKKSYKNCSWKSWIIAINGQRNIGKTSGVWTHLVTESMTTTSRIMYLRLRDAQLVFAVRDLNNKFKNRFYFSKTHIYTLIKTVSTDSKGVEHVDYEKGEVIGYMGTISTYSNIKSGEFANVEYIFFDEYNEDTNQLNIYKNFINIITTCIRFSQTKIIMLGNRDSANNDFMVRWKIEPRDNNDIDEFQRFSDNGFFVELGDQSYADLGNDRTLFYQLAQCDRNTKRYLDGGYMRDFSDKIINFDKYIEPTFTPKYRIAVKGLSYTYGTFLKDSLKKYCFISTDNYDNDTLKMFSLDNLSDIKHESKLLDDDDKNDIYERLFKKVKSLSIYFDTFDAKRILEEAITRHQLFR